MEDQRDLSDVDAGFVKCNALFGGAAMTPLRLLLERECATPADICLSLKRTLGSIIRAPHLAR